MILFFLIFGVISVSWFKGKLFKCLPQEMLVNFKISSKWDCVNGGGEWENLIYNFDDIPNALVTLFVL